MRKGSLSLSINAVVVLVLAIALLGLGLAFTKGMFDKLKGNLVDAIQPPDYQATSEEPIAISSKFVTMKKNQDARLPLSFYNNHNKAGVWPQMECFGGEGDGSWDALETAGAVIVAPQTVQSGSEKSFAYTLKYAQLEGILGIGDFVCNIRFVVCDDTETQCSGMETGEAIETLQYQLQIQ